MNPVWKIVLIIFIIISVVGAWAVYYYEPEGACEIHVREVNESVARNGTVVHLTEQDFKEHPVLVEVVKGEKPISRLLRRDGVIADRREAKYIGDRFMGNIAEEKYVEYGGKYHELRLYIR